MRASIGDYIICGIKGEFYPCKPDIFENSYELVGDSKISTKSTWIQWTGENLGTVKYFTMGNYRYSVVAGTGLESYEHHLVVKVGGKWEFVPVGHFIVQDVNSNLSIMDSEAIETLSNPQKETK